MLRFNLLASCLMLGTALFLNSAELSNDLPLFQEVEVLKGLGESRSIWFQVPPNVELSANHFVQLNYVCTPLILPPFSTITVLLNDVPINSRRLESSNEPVQWNVPLTHLKLNQQWNEIRITTRQQILEAVCENLDANANWVKILPSSFVHIDKHNQAPMLLRAYPYPFYDNLSRQPDNSIWFLPPKAKPYEIATMLQLASNWGGLNRNLLPKIIVSNTSEIQSNLSDRIMIGELSSWKDAASVKIKPSNGFLGISSNGSNHYSLLISGSDETGLKKSIAFLTNPRLIKQVLQSSYEVNAAYPLPFGVPTQQAGLWTFADIKQEGILISGALQHKASFTVRRPLNWKISPDAALTVRFKHAAALDPLRSQLSVFINQIPAGSIILSQSNAENGEIFVPIPASELGKSSWFVEFVAFHEMHSRVCSLDLSQTAWTYIEDTSQINLTEGNIGALPDLQFFPFLQNAFTTAGRSVVMWLPENPAPGILTFAAKLAARAAQVNHTPLTWSVVIGSSLTPEAQNADAIIALGYFEENKRWKSVDSVMWASFEDGRIKPKSNLLIADSLEGWKAVLQACISPWNPKGVIYMVQAKDENMFTKMSESILSIPQLTRLKGVAALVDSDEEIVTIE